MPLGTALGTALGKALETALGTGLDAGLRQAFESRRGADDDETCARPVVVR